jgi:hypothetical protein
VRRIALVGTASSGALAPYHDPSWEIWGVSARASYVTRANRWFELHRLGGEPEDWAAKWRACMKGFTQNIPEVVMMYPEPDLAPKVVRYPREKICWRFETYFMTSTFAWMMALAIEEMVPLGTIAPKDSEIGIWGVDMEYGTEYRQQRAGFRHFIGVAQQLGIKVTRLASTGLSYEPVPYPMWQDDPLLAKLDMRSKEASANIEKYETSLRLTRGMIAGTRAAMEEIQRARQPDYDAVGRLKALEKELADFMQTSATLSEQIVYAQGVNSEQRWLNDYLQP